MDIITQVVLGASVGEAVLGKKVGSKAALWGGLGGLFPDLDIVLSPLLGLPVSLLFHRGITHSFIIAFVLSPLFAMAVSWIYKHRVATTYDWAKLFFFTLITHPILDIFTSYGTGFFEPFSDMRIALSSIAIVDLFYTLPLVVALVLTFFMKQSNIRRRLVMLFALGITSLYLGYTLINKMYVTSVFGEKLQNESIVFSRLHTFPLLPHNFKWMAVAEVDQGYCVRYYSHFGNAHVPGYFVPKNDSLACVLNAFPSFHILKQFSKDLYALKKIDENTFEYYDMRFGKLGNTESADFVFAFVLSIQDNTLTVVQKPRKFDFSMIDF